MGLLPQVADGVGVSIPTAGHLISAYALGVVVGAPVLAFLGARLPRRGLLIALMVAYAGANALSAVAGSYGLLLLARLPRRRARTAPTSASPPWSPPAWPPRGREGRAVAMVMIGLSVANVVGVPGRHLDGPAPRLALGVLGRRRARRAHGRPGRRSSCRPAPATPTATGRRELSLFAEPQAWLTLLAGAIGFGGMFALYSYIAKVVTDVGGLSDGAVPVFLLAFGLGMVAGTYVAGALADWSVFRSLLGSSLAMAPAAPAVRRPGLGRLVGSGPRVPGGGLLLGARGQPPAAPDVGGRRRPDPGRRDEPLLPQRRQRPRRLARRARHRRRLGATGHRRSSASSWRCSGLAVLLLSATVARRSA